MLIFIVFDKISQNNRQKAAIKRKKAEEKQALLMVVLLVGVEGLSRFIKYRKKKEIEQEKGDLKN